MGKRIMVLILLCISVFSCNYYNDVAKGEVDYLSLLKREPDKTVVTIVCDKPYEKQLTYPSILTLSDRYIMYYSAYDEILDEKFFYICYAESIDGIIWNKPSFLWA
jgi:hypothetical protein